MVFYSNYTPLSDINFESLLFSTSWMPEKYRTADLSSIQMCICLYQFCKLKSKCYNVFVRKCTLLFPLWHTVSNEKTHLDVFKICPFRVYLRNLLSYKKVIYIYVHSCLKSFQIWSKNQLIFAKTLFCQKKVSYWKNPPFRKNQKKFSWI